MLEPICLTAPIKHMNGLFIEFEVDVVTMIDS